MRIAIDKDDLPCFMIEQMWQHQELRAVYKSFGIAGIHYAILFGWEGSSFRRYNITDDERDKMVCDEVYKADLYDPRQDKYVNCKPKKLANMYNVPMIKQAIERLNIVAKVPVLELANFYEVEIEKIKKKIGAITLSSTDQAVLAKETANRKLLIDSLKTMQALYDEAEAKILASLRDKKKSSVNDFLALLTEQHG